MSGQGNLPFSVQERKAAKLISCFCFHFLSADEDFLSGDVFLTFIFISESLVGPSAAA